MDKICDIFNIGWSFEILVNIYKKFDLLIVFILDGIEFDNLF